MTVYAATTRALAPARDETAAGNAPLRDLRMAGAFVLDAVGAALANPLDLSGQALAGQLKAPPPPVDFPPAVITAARNKCGRDTCGGLWDLV